MDPLTAISIIMGAIKVGSALIDAAQKLHSTVETAQAEGRELTEEEAAGFQKLQNEAVEALRLQLIAEGADLSE